MQRASSDGGLKQPARISVQLLPHATWWTSRRDASRDPRHRGVVVGRA